MHFIVITIMPEMFSALTKSGITARAINKNKVQLSLINPREFTADVHQTVDDRPFGGGPGMVMMAEPLAQAIEKAKALAPSAKVYYLGPQGQHWQQSKARALAENTSSESVILLCGRYEGVDQRILDSYVDDIISVGDYVVSGGELPAMLVMDSIIRLLPGVLGNADSAVEDSFTQDGVIDYPHYTRPAIWREHPAPKVLLSGDHAAIAHWRAQQMTSKPKV